MDSGKSSEEYQFVDSGEVGDLPAGESAESKKTKASLGSNLLGAFKSQKIPPQTRVFVVAGIIVFLLIVKLLWSHFSASRPAISGAQHSASAALNPALPVPLAVSAPPAPAANLAVAQPQPSTGASADAANNSSIGLDDQSRADLDLLQNNYKNIQAEISSINSQIDVINGASNQLSAKVSDVYQTMNQISANLVQQSAVIQQLYAKISPPKTASSQKKSPVVLNRYFLQAIIPGRAWLIAANGTTMTVREGTFVDDYYGNIKSIDALRGQVLTSTGKIFQFSQQDS